MTLRRDEPQTLTTRQLLDQVGLIQQVMQAVMKPRVHYDVIPGCGDKPALLKPGAEKLAMTFRIRPEFEETVIDLQNGHREYRVICSLFSIASGYPVGEGVGSCSTMESKYRFRTQARTCPDCNTPAIAVSKPEWGGGFYCSKKHGGCGAKFPADNVAIIAQKTGRTEHDNPADFYNTALKMSKKRAFVDAILTATAASDCFVQDMEAEERDNATVKDDTRNDTTQAADGFDASKREPYAGKRVTRVTPETGWRDVEIHFGKNKGVRLGDLKQASLEWYQKEFQAKEYPEGSGRISPNDQRLRGALDQSMKGDGESMPTPPDEPTSAPDPDESLPF